MTAPHKRPSRHPKYKTAYRVNNGRAYEHALRHRGDLTLWMSPEALSAWRAPLTGTRGAQPVYADVAIETARTLRLLLRLSLRQTEGCLHALLTLMEVTLPCPDHTTRSRRHAMVGHCQVVEAETLIRRVGAPPWSSLPFRQPASCP